MCRNGTAYRLLGLVLVIFFIGCANDSGSTSTVPLPTEEPIDSVQNSSEALEPSHDSSMAYPEKEDTMRLLVQASELESQGKFHDALVVTNHAIAVDPGSPMANEMKVRLEELLRHI